jgi:hypothetical protein
MALSIAFGLGCGYPDIGFVEIIKKNNLELKHVVGCQIPP